jgi:hypothetical protein
MEVLSIYIFEKAAVVMAKTLKPTGRWSRAVWCTISPDNIFIKPSVTKERTWTDGSLMRSFDEQLFSIHFISADAIKLSSVLYLDLRFKKLYPHNVVPSKKINHCTVGTLYTLNPNEKKVIWLTEMGVLLIVLDCKKMSQWSDRKRCSLVNSLCLSR